MQLKTLLRPHVSLILKTIIHCLLSCQLIVTAKIHSYSWMAPHSLVKSRMFWAGISIPQASVPDSANYFRTSLSGLTSFLIIITKIVFWVYCLLEHLFWCSNGKRLCTISQILIKLFHCPGCLDHALQAVLMES